MTSQYEFSLPSFSRGYHVITDLVMKQLDDLPDVGILNLFIKHTSAAVTINESADPDVLADFESIFNHIIPENLPFLKHTMEGADDMPAHIKAAMIGSSIQIPITNGRLNLGIWQGIYLCEFRNRGGARKLVATVIS
ncbi:secondary thiamine-phosphate synthase enzyme YjbQ [Saprospiraceae bacterium]|nr:secondary thiamine-phosphate synthase enzyme YjbQ [Saprospiraceae bacterium]MDB4824581.1 secondary thiamine-phosphate synthase enzyme YjbQ [Saprospiraceae bacterium]MDB9914287.1 secondary thiamine-phosphate synthase enzyme YjbQ [Saprospiraceae bacterium]